MTATAGPEESGSAASPSCSAGFTGEVPDPERFGPVGELFEFLQNAIGRDAARIDATFHPELGYPVEVFVDFDELLADEELGFTVRSLSAT